MLRLPLSALLSFYLLLSAVTAQFQFFGDFFGQQGQQQGQQERQNVASDSNWYRQTWENGKHVKSFGARQDCICTCRPSRTGCRLLRSSASCIEVWKLTLFLQHTARISCALIHWPVSTFLIIVHVRIPMLKTSSNLETEAGSV
jgi:hypothetical protein